MLGLLLFRYKGKLHTSVSVTKTIKIPGR